MRLHMIAKNINKKMMAGANIIATRAPGMAQLSVPHQHIFRVVYVCNSLLMVQMNEQISRQLFSSAFVPSKFKSGVAAIYRISINGTAS